MNNDLDIAKIESNLPSEKTNTYNFEQSGQGTNIGLAQNAHNTTVNIMLPVSNGTIALFKKQSIWSISIYLSF